MLKRSFDILVSIFALVILSPLVLVIAFLIKLSSDGPVIFKQKRIGKNGTPFTIYKFRTMVKGAEKLKKKLMKLNEVEGPVFKIKNDPRYTKIGKFIAQIGVDETPQLINVLKGEMSLVGPRPLPPEEAKRLKAKDRVREEVIPGITSLWVIRGAHNLTFGKWMELDRYYIKNQSLLLDIKIFVKTVSVILRAFLNIIS